MKLQWTIPQIKPTPPSPLQKFDKGGLTRDSFGLAGGLDIVFPTRSLDEIAQQLMQGKSVSILEMALLLQAKEQWGFWRSQNSSSYIASTICRQIQHDVGLYNDCVWRSLYSKKEASYFFPTEIVEGLLKIQSEYKDIFHSLYHEQYQLLVQFALQQRITPQQLLQQFHLPLKDDVFPKTTKSGIDYYLQQTSKFQLANEQWLIQCLQELLESQRHASVNHLLNRIKKDDLTLLPLLQKQLYLWYPKRSSQFQHLNRHSQSMLKLFDILRGWNIFETFTEKYFGYRIRDVQTLFNKRFQTGDRRIQARHALARMGIWSNYTSHMKQVVFFVPTSMRTVIQKHSEFQNVDSSVFQYADIYTPCLVFQIAHVTVVQYLWSEKYSPSCAGFATFYQQTPYIPQPNEAGVLPLLKSVQVFGKEWQKNLYLAIQNYLNLSPNEGWSEFRGYPARYIDERTRLPRV